MATDLSQYRIAIIIPCYNEASTIGSLIAALRAAELPSGLAADIFVFDNNSTDGTGAAAAAQGAIVRRVSLQGKGNVVRA